FRPDHSYLQGGVGTIRTLAFGLCGAGFRITASKRGFTGPIDIPHATLGAPVGLAGRTVSSGSVRASPRGAGAGVGPGAGACGPAVTVTVRPRPSRPAANPGN